MKNEYRKKTLPFKMVLLFLAIALVIDISITVISAVVYRNKTVQEHKRVCLGISEAVATNVRGNKVDEWVSGQNKKEYSDVGGKFINIMKSIPDIKSIRVCRMNNSGMHLIYNIQRENMKNIGSGKTVPYDSYLESKRDALLEGERIEVIVMSHAANTVMCALTPIKDQDNKVVCYAICEISTENIAVNSYRYAKKIFLVMGIVSAVLALIISLYMNRKFVGPFGKLDERLRGFADDADTGEEVKSKLRKLEIKGSDEISRMYNGFVKLIDEVRMKSDEVKEFDRNVVKQMNEVLKRKDGE